MRNIAPTAVQRWAGPDTRTSKAHETQAQARKEAPW